MKLTENDNKKFIVDSMSAFTSLFESAKQKNELHYAFALCPGDRPYHFESGKAGDFSYQTSIGWYCCKKKCEKAAMNF